MKDPPITEVTLSPGWMVTLAHIDGSAHILLRIRHPRFGLLDFLLPSSDAMNLAAAIAKTSERRDTARISGAAKKTK